MRTSTWLPPFAICLFFSSAVSGTTGSWRLLLDEGRELLQIEAAGADSTDRVTIGGEVQRLDWSDGRAVLNIDRTRVGRLLAVRFNDGKVGLYHYSATSRGGSRLLKIPLWLSVLPPLVAIVLALIFREVILSLFLGIFTGSVIAGGLRVESPVFWLESFLRVVYKYVIEALSDTGHLSVIVFSLLIGGMVAIISRNGGMSGVVLALARYATSPARAQLVTWLLGIAVFFDDYANTLVVGNTMRPVTDRFRVSREKLAYIVDSTAAPIAAVAFITTWIGAELGYIDGGIRQIEDFGLQVTPYGIFVSSLKYSFYPLLTLIFVLLVIVLKRDFGPMYRAEHRARSTGQVSTRLTAPDDESRLEDLAPVHGAPKKWQHAFWPVVTVIVMTVVGLVQTGLEGLEQQLRDVGASVAPTWGDIWSNLPLLAEGQEPSFFRKMGLLIGSADSYVALLWASLTGATLAIGITLWNKVMKTTEVMETLTMGFKSMMPALIILTLAWSLAITTEELQTAAFISSSLVGSVSPYILPAVVFLLAAAIAFSTGSSWSTMAILYPIAIPTAWAVCRASGMDDAASFEILLNVIATVLAASVLGDHCSPISDTTILSSLASDCNHIDHVRTQLPYALVVGGAALLCCLVTSFLHGGWLLTLLLIGLSVAAFYGILKLWGQPVSDQAL